jgi:hypothetical protein
MERMAISAENTITKCKIACAAGDIERIYENLDIMIPPKIKVAMFLAYQFETSDFNFDIIHREEILQAEYEEIEKEEIAKIAGEKGLMAIKKAFPEKKKLEGEESPLTKEKKNAFSRRTTIAEKSEKQQVEVEPIVMRQMNRKSYLGEACAKAIEQQMDKMTNIDKEIVYHNKEKISKLEEQN